MEIKKTVQARPKPMEMMVIRVRLRLRHMLRQASRTIMMALPQCRRAHSEQIILYALSAMRHALRSMNRLNWIQPCCQGRRVEGGDQANDQHENHWKIDHFGTYSGSPDRVKGYTANRVGTGEDA